MGVAGTAPGVGTRGLRCALGGRRSGSKARSCRSHTGGSCPQTGQQFFPQESLPPGVLGLLAPTGGSDRNRFVNIGFSETLVCILNAVPFFPPAQLRITMRSNNKHASASGPVLTILHPSSHYSLEQPHEVAITTIFILHMKKLPMQVAIQVERHFSLRLGREEV